MISSLPILMRQRSKDQVAELLTLVSMIPCKPEDKIVRERVLERFMNIEQSENSRVKEGNKARLVMKQKIEEGLITEGDNTDPFRQLLVRAILANQNWGTIIAANKWSKFFAPTHEVWSLYELWIIFLCYQGFQKDKARFLSSNITKRSNKIMVLKSHGFKTSYYRNKFKKWISKDISELKLVHYEIERNLLISIKLGESFTEAAEGLNLEQILKTASNPLEDDRNDWILFLCTKFEDNYPMKKPDFDSEKQKFTWIEHKINVRHKLNDFQTKLAVILNQYASFQDYFTNQIEASLLLDIKHKNSWKTAENHINELFLMNLRGDKRQIMVNPKNGKDSVHQFNNENQNLNSANRELSSKHYNLQSDRQSLNSNESSASLLLISSLPIVLLERSKDKVRELFIMSSLIDYNTDQQKFIKQKFIERVLNCDSTDKFKGSKQQYKAHLKILRQQILERRARLQDIEDPVEHFLVKAIVQDQSWGSLIAKNKWANLFHTNHDTWSMYEQWLIFLCFQGFNKEKAKFLASTITKRSNTIIKLQLTGFKTSYYFRKFNKWMSKDVSQLQLIHYELERNLLISIKLGQTIFEVARRLNVQEMLKSVANPIENQRNDWLLYLVTQFEDNYPIKKPEFNKETQQIEWSEIQINVKYKVTEYQQKLESILGKYTNFFLFFTNELEASLLSDIKQKNSWKVAETHINQLFSSSAQSQNQQSTAKYEQNVKTERIQPSLYDESDLSQTNSFTNSAITTVKEEYNPVSNKQTAITLQNTDKPKPVLAKIESVPPVLATTNTPSQSNNNSCVKNSFVKQVQINPYPSKINDRLVFPTEKCQKYSLIKKSKEPNHSQDKDFTQTGFQTSKTNETSSKKMPEPIYQSLLKKYKENPDILKKMGSEEIKTFLEMTLSNNLKNMDNLTMGDADQDCYEDESMDDEDVSHKDLNQSFVIGFDELVTRVKSKETAKPRAR